MEKLQKAGITRQRHMDLKHLRYFLEIIDEGSFSRAARNVHVAQPALSFHVKNMEAELGTPLLLRSPSGVTPTEAGTLLASRARAILTQVAQTHEDIRSLGKSPSGAVRLGLPGTISAIVAMPLIAALRAQYPDITINIAEAMSGFVGDWLRDGQIDLAVLYNEINDRTLHAEPLVEEELVMFGPAGATVSDAVSLDDLSGLPMVLPSAQHGLRAMLDRALKQRQIVLNPAIEIDSYSNIKSLVTAGYGFSVLPFHAVAHEVDAGTLVVRHFHPPRLWRRAHLVNVANRPMTRATEVVRDILRDTVTELLDTGGWKGARAAPDGTEDAATP